MPKLLSYELPDTLEGSIAFLDRFHHLINEDSRRGKMVREAYSRVKDYGQNRIEKAKDDNPLAFLQVSYEQSCKLNAWIWGINFLIDFDANRVGKTANTVFNALLWMFPNNPEYKVFTPYIDEWDRKVHVLPRPTFEHFLKIQDYLDENPDMRGDPLKGLDDSDNAEKFANLQSRFPWAFKPAWPEPSFTAKINVIWLGAPDVDYHKNIIMPEWRKWLPKSTITHDSDFNKTFTISIIFTTRYGGRRQLVWEIVCKSYESKDTKWSGAAVRGIILTEGLKKETLNEIKQRFQTEAFASWDYTPYEARNTGSKSALAHRVFQRKEELPLRSFVWTGFGIEKCPDFIMSKRKKEDLIRQWKGKPQGQARIHGHFFSDTPQALSNLDREFHCLTWTKEELFCKFANGLIFRGFDPGYDHPSSCVWGLLSPQNDWYIYRIWSQAGLSIGDRVRQILLLSGNRQTRYNEHLSKECNTLEKSEKVICTIADYHLFKTDEITERPYIQNYAREGLILRPSITMRPRDRALEVNRLFEKSNFKKHPERNCTPGSRVYFLINEDGVDQGVEKLENVFWERYAKGEMAGMPKDELQSHGDDELDALSYLILSPFRWSSSIKPNLCYPTSSEEALTSR